MIPRSLFYYPIRFLAVGGLLRRCVNQRTVVLSYDDGPGKLLTQRLLEMLAGHDARATFFLLGRRIAGNDDMVSRLRDAGHELGVHTYDHGHAWKLSTSAAIADIDAGYDAAAPWVAPDGLFRPPHGKVTFATWRALRRRGARICWWTVDSGDTWDVLPPVTRASEMVARAGGGVVLMHDFDRGPDRERFVLETTEALLRTAKQEGLRVMTLSELFSEGR